MGSQSIMKILQFYIYINVTIITFCRSRQLINIQEIIFIEKFIYFAAFNQDNI